MCVEAGFSQIQSHICIYDKHVKLKANVFDYVQFKIGYNLLLHGSPLLICTKLNKKAISLKVVHIASQLCKQEWPTKGHQIRIYKLDR